MKSTNETRSLPDIRFGSSEELSHSFEQIRTTLDPVHAVFLILGLAVVTFTVLVLLILGGTEFYYWYKSRKRKLQEISAAVASMPLAVEKFHSLAFKTDTVFDDYAQLKQYLLNSESFGSGGKLIDFVVNSVSAIIALYRANDTYARMAVVQLYASSLQLPNINGLVGKLFTTGILPVIVRLRELVTMRLLGIMTGQGDDEDDSTIKLAYGAIGKLFGSVFGLKGSVVSKNDVHAMSAMRHGFGLVKDTSSALNWLVHITWLSYCALYYKVTGRPYATDENKILIAEALAWVDKVEDHIKGDNPTQRVETYPNYAHATLQLRADGFLIHRKLLQCSYTRTNFTIFFECWKTISALGELATATLAINKNRREPLFVHLTGDPCAGKTVCLDMLFNDLMRLRGMKYTLSEKYTRMVSSEYWEGYHGQFAVMYDDIFQRDDM